MIGYTYMNVNLSLKEFTDKWRKKKKHEQSITMWYDKIRCRQYNLDKESLHLLRGIRRFCRENRVCARILKLSSLPDRQRCSFCLECLFSLSPSRYGSRRQSSVFGLWKISIAEVQFVRVAVLSTTEVSENLMNILFPLQIYKHTQLDMKFQEVPEAYMNHEVVCL